MRHLPAVVTRALWARIEDLVACQDVAGRLHDVLYMAICNARRHAGESRFEYQLHLRARSDRARLQTLIADIGPGDDVITTAGGDDDVDAFYSLGAFGPRFRGRWAMAVGFSSDGIEVEVPDKPEVLS